VTASDRISLAVPNKGRLMAPTADLLHDAGLLFERTERTLTTSARNAPVDLMFVRTEDVVEMVADGVADAGIVGLDLLEESETPLPVLAELGYGHCRLAAAVPTTSPLQSLDDLEGARVATAHPRLTSRLLGSRGIDATIVPLHGSVEAAPKLGVADAVADLVSSGSTLLVNGLRPLATLLPSQAVLVARAEPPPGVLTLATMLRAVVSGRRKRYVLMNAPREAVPAIERLIPGLAAPSVIPLAHNGHVAVHSVIEADDLWDLLPRLEAAGATGILVLPIEQLLA
jgi:ATP phosphoribosyltransferase